MPDRTLEAPLPRLLGASRKDAMHLALGKGGAVDPLVATKRAELCRQLPFVPQCAARMREGRREWCGGPHNRSGDPT